MKKIINGKLYNTETAKLICGYSFGNPNDFRRIDESLHKSPNGQFFIEYDGGPLTEYAVKFGQHEFRGSNGIRLVDIDEAKEFVESHGKHNDYINAFGEPELG